MATKTITIDIEAYKRLKGVQKPNESFSQTIKRVIRRPFDLDTWLKKFEQKPISKEAAEAIEYAIASRKTRSNRER
ncbi:MAG TPA: antitoxin VapB family protein [Tepidisphaeraceae bacterium]|jgi:predicted CopG family antitoxin|nr:antitoxin VapB family protein [Tepidisphaeraceae bacterium]